MNFPHHVPFLSIPAFMQNLSSNQDIIRHMPVRDEADLARPDPLSQERSDSGNNDFNNNFVESTTQTDWPE